MMIRKGVSKASGITLIALAIVASLGCGDNVQPSSEKAITEFRFVTSASSALTTDVIATISGSSITATVPAGTSVVALVASFESTGASVTVGQTAQVSGTTPNDFTDPVTYRVNGADGSFREYMVTVTIASAAAKEITAYAFLAADNSGLAGDVTATINGTSIAATVPFGTDVNSLVASFSSTGVAVAVGGIAQVSGTTANTFASTVTYRVTAADSSTRDYTVTVTVAANTAKEITAYAFLAADNSGLVADIAATINGNSIAATVPFGTDVTALIATFSSTGVGVAVGGIAQVSGTTSNTFTSTVTYRVTAADSSTRDYTVTVTVAANTAKELTAYAFLSTNNPGLDATVTATITGTTISATVPFDTDVTALVATFATTGETVAVGATAQVSGATANNFASPVIYRVTAADGSTKDFSVTVTVAASPAKEITSFVFLTIDNPQLGADVTATITGNTIDATLPLGTDVTALVATFATTGTNVAVGATTQVSGMTANDFAGPVIYRVTAADASTRYYTVTASPARLRCATTATGGFSEAYDVVRTNDGSVFVTGGFSGTTTFGAGEPDETTLISVGSGIDGFAARYRPDCTLVWARRTAADYYGSNVYVSSDGQRIVLAGVFGGTITIGAGEPNEKVLVSAGGNDVFVVSLSAAGAVDWARSFGGPSDDSFSDVGQAGGDIWVAGNANSTITMGASEPAQTTIGIAGHEGLYLARFQPTGDLAWARFVDCGDMGFGCAVYHVAGATDGRVFMTGWADGWATFGPGEPGETTVELISSSYIAGYAPDGTLVWAKRTVTYSGEVLGLALDETNGTLLATGVTNSVVLECKTFGAGEPAQTAICGYNDAFFARFRMTDGNLVWVKAIAENGYGYPAAWDVAVAADGSLVVVGTFQWATFGPGEPNATTLLTTGGDDLFVARYHADGTLSWVERAVGSGSEYARDVAVAPDATSFVVGSFGATGGNGTTTTFGAGEPGETTLTATSGQGNMFLASYGP